MSNKHPAVVDPNRLQPCLLEDAAVYLVLADGRPAGAFATYLEAQVALGECQRLRDGKAYTTTTLRMRPSPMAENASLLSVVGRRFRFHAAKAPLWNLLDPDDTADITDRGFQGVELDCGVTFEISDVEVPGDWRFCVDARWRPLGEMQQWMFLWLRKRLSGES